MKRLALFGLFILALAAPLRSAWAQQVASPDEKARQAFEAGRTAYTEGRFREAAVLFEQSFNLSGRPKLLINLGNAWVKLNDREKAASAFRAYLRMEPESPDRPVLEARIKDLEEIAFPSPEIAVKEEAPPPTIATPQDREPPSQTGIIAGRTWTWVAAAGSAAFGAAAVGFWVSANSSYDALASTCGKQPSGCGQGSIDKVSGRVTATNVFLGLSALSLAASVALWFIEGSAHDIANASLSGEGAAAAYLPFNTPGVIRGRF
jgi:tetratricopeptide (TPR) repeat protein